MLGVARRTTKPHWDFIVSKFAEELSAKHATMHSSILVSAASPLSVGPK